MNAWQVAELGERREVTRPVEVADHEPGGVDLLGLTLHPRSYQVATRVTSEREDGDKPLCVVDTLEVVVS